LEEPTLETISEDTLSATEARVQSSSGWRQAESAVFAETDSKRLFEKQLEGIN
jgi:hypothetical protein